MNDTALISKSNESSTIPFWGIREDINTPDFNVELELSPVNKRIILYQYKLRNTAAVSVFVEYLDNLCDSNGFGKVWGKLPEEDSRQLLKYGFIREAAIPSYFAPGKDAVICSRFYGERKLSRNTLLNKQMVMEMQKSATVNCEINSCPGYHFKIAGKNDTRLLANLYQQVFASYPYPVHDPGYLQRCMDYTRYMLAFREDQLVAAASAEMNCTYRNAEMTDFATLPSERGRGLAAILLQQLEREMSSANIHSLYTLARSTSPSMNQVFKKMGYKYTGTLINNCHIAGDFEDMNVYCKMT